MKVPGLELINTLQNQGGCNAAAAAVVSVEWCCIAGFLGKVLTTRAQELGNGGHTDAEERAHFGLWVIMKSPIILGTDATRLKSSKLKLSIIKNQVIFA
jgi:hypothetical protein